MMKSNPIPSGWMTHKLENNNTKEVLNPTSGFPANSQPKGPPIPRFPRESALKASRIGLQDFHKTGETTDSSLRGHKQIFRHTKTQRKGASVGGSPVEEGWVRRGSPQGRGHPAWKVLLGVYPLGGCQHPTIDLESWVALGQKNTREGA